MSVLKEMKAVNSRQINALSARQSAIDLIEWTGQQLQVLGFAADFTGNAKDEVTLHCRLVLKGRGRDAEVSAAPAAQAGIPALKPPPRAPRKKADAPPKLAPGKSGAVTGPYSKAEIATIHEMLDDGATNGEIATALRREARPVSTKLATVRRQRREAADGNKGARSQSRAPKRKSVPDAPVRSDVPAAKPAPIKPATPVNPEPERPSAKPSRPSRGGAVPFDTGTSHADRVLAAHLNALGYAGGWTAARDLDLIQSLTRGLPVAMVADTLGVESGDVVRRFKALNDRPGDLDHQSRLIRMLRARAEGASA